MKLFTIQIVLALVFIGMGNAVYAADLNGIWKSDIADASILDPY
jgi:hypothetical protein